MQRDIPDIIFKSRNDSTDIEYLDISEIMSRASEDRTHDPHMLHRLSFFAVLIVTSGSGEHRVDMESYQVAAGSVLVIAKGQIHAFQRAVGYEGVLLVFTEDFVLKYFATSSLEHFSHLYDYHLTSPHIDGSELNREFLSGIERELAHVDSYLQKDILAKLLELYLLRLERVSRNPDSPVVNAHYVRVFYQLRDMIARRHRETRMVKDYAQWMAITPKHLNAIVRAVTGKSAKVFIDEYVILEIKRQILTVDMSLKEISYFMGFDEVTNFTKFFKRHVGCTPSAFKKSILRR